MTLKKVERQQLDTLGGFCDRHGRFHARCGRPGVRAPPEVLVAASRGHPFRVGTCSARMVVMSMQAESVLGSYLAAGDGGDYSAMARWLDERVVTHSPGGVTTQGIAAQTAAWASAHAGLRDLRHDVQDLVVGEGTVAARTLVTGVHRGDFLGIPATGRAVCVDQALFARVANGRILELWEVVDTARGLQQIGAIAEQPLAPGT